jgi:hypothetical protein
MSPIAKYSIKKMPLCPTPSKLDSIYLFFVFRAKILFTVINLKYFSAQIILNI